MKIGSRGGSRRVKRYPGGGSASHPRLVFPIRGGRAYPIAPATRRTASTRLLLDYEQLLLTYGTDHEEVRHEHTTVMIDEFFAPALCHERVFGMRQQLDYEGVAGRLLSSSYAPLEGHPSHAPMMQELQRIFRARATDDTVAFEYNTRVFYGKLDKQ